MKNKLDFTKNLQTAIIAQGVNVIFSCIVSLILPKFLGVEQYSYWQLFIFLTTYSGALHFGLSDGIYLRYGGEVIENIDYRLIGSQLKIMNFVHIVFCVIVSIFLCATLPCNERLSVYIFAMVFTIIANATWFLGYVFQATNLTRIFSHSVMILNGSFLLFLSFLCFTKQKSFKWYCFCYVIAMFLSLVYISIKGKKIVFSGLVPMSFALNEIKSNIIIGINLTIANVASSLILGIGRIVVDRTEGITSFGLLSLALSLTNFFLQFILQVSMVLFPALRRLSNEMIKRTFVILQDNIGFVLYGILVLYIPIKKILLLWLPSYSESFYYMVFLLPICVFDGKMQLLYGTFMKVLRREKELFRYNIIALMVSFILCLVSAFYFHNIIFVAISMTTAIFVRYLISCIHLNMYYSIRYEKRIMFEVVMTSVFVISNLLLEEINAFLLMICLYGCYIFNNRSYLSKLVKK